MAITRRHRHRCFLLHQLRARCWGRTKSRSSRTSVRAETTAGGYRRCATASPATATLGAVCDAPHPGVPALPAQHSGSTPFYPAIAEPDRVRSGQLLVKMLQITIEILLPIALRHPLQHRRGHPLRQRLPSPPVKQPAKPALLVTVPPPHVPVRSLSAA